MLRAGALSDCAIALRMESLALGLAMPLYARTRSAKNVSLSWRWLWPSTKRENLSNAGAILKRFQLIRELKDKRGQRACHNACGEGRPLGNRFKKAFESCFDEKSIDIDLSMTWKS